MTMPILTRIIKRTIDALLDRLPSRRHARHLEQTGPLRDYVFPEPDRPRPSSELSTKSPMPIMRIVASDLEIITFDDDHELRIPRLRKRR